MFIYAHGSLVYDDGDVYFYDPGTGESYSELPKEGRHGIDMFG